MSGILYGLIAAGYCNETGRFWDAIIWPIYLGKAIARAAIHSKEKADV
jgi:hypothetical protein